MDSGLKREVLGKICLMAGTGYTHEGMCVRVRLDNSIDLSPLIVALLEWKFGLLHNPKYDRLVWLEMLLKVGVPEQEAMHVYESFSRSGDFSMLGFRFGILGVTDAQIRAVTLTSWPVRPLMSGHALGQHLVDKSKKPKDRLKACQKALQLSGLSMETIRPEIERVAPEMVPALSLQITFKRGLIPKLER